MTRRSDDRDDRDGDQDNQPKADGSPGTAIVDLGVRVADVGVVRLDLVHVSPSLRVAKEPAWN
jgi:hypothetical protein